MKATNPPIVRMTANDRRESILDAALKLATKVGFTNFTSIGLARTLDCNHPVIFHYFKSMDALRDAVMERAITKKNIKVLLDGLACKNAIALSAPDELKDLARSSI